MQIIRELGQSPDRTPTTLTIGVFDGVHRGHHHLIERIITRAHELHGRSAVLTFDPHPDLIVHPDRERLYLSSLEERAALLQAIGVDLLVIQTFNLALMELTAQAYMDLICGAMELRELYVGPGFALGRGREGNIPRLRQIGAKLGFEVFQVEPLLIDGEVVSSTRIRRLLREGLVAEVEPLLGRPFGVRGPVVEGDRRGRTIGFPTANLAIDDLHLLPADGVYVCQATVEGDNPAIYHAVTNIGVRPTFAGFQRRVEAHLLDMHADLYGRHLTLTFLKRLRPEQRFSGVEALVAQIRQDVADARAFLANY